jgi:Ca-activated chloride channel family protein
LEVKVSNFFSKIKEPVLANPTLQFTSDIHPSKLYPTPLPDLFKGEQLVLVGRYSGQGSSAATIEGTVNGTTRKFSYDVKFDDSSENEFIPRLWATRRVGYLLDEIRLHGENSELRDEVTDLARKYAIVTPYTAYLILEDEKRREVPTVMRSLQSLDRDADALHEANLAWHSYVADNTGDAGIAGARSSMALKSANAPAPAAAGADFAFRQRYGLNRVASSVVTNSVVAVESGPARLAQYTQQSRFVAGKTFFQNGEQWLDSELQKFPNARRVKLAFGSQDYFDFVTGHPKAQPWLALGQKVQFVMDGTVYEIGE